MSFWEPSSFGQMREAFAAQFEYNNDGYVYRRNGNGAAVSVSAAEHRRFIADYDTYLSRLRWLMCVWLILPLLLAFGIVFWFEIFDSTLSYLVIVAAIVPGFAAVISSSQRAMSAPAKALARRSVEAPPLAPHEARRAAFKHISWSSLMIAPAFAIWIAYKNDVATAPFAKDRVFWTILAASIILLALVQALRKWRIERNDRHKQ